MRTKIDTIARYDDQKREKWLGFVREFETDALAQCMELVLANAAPNFTAAATILWANLDCDLAMLGIENTTPLKRFLLERTRLIDEKKRIRIDTANEISDTCG